MEFTVESQAGEQGRRPLPLLIQKNQTKVPGPSLIPVTAFSKNVVPLQPPAGKSLLPGQPLERKLCRYLLHLPCSSPANL